MILVLTEKIKKAKGSVHVLKEWKLKCRQLADSAPFGLFLFQLMVFK